MWALSADYLFSNNQLNRLLRIGFDFDDDELVSWFLSFCKCISFLVSKNTVKLFINERAPDFPLFAESMKFFTDADPMVRANARHIALSVFKGKTPPRW